MLKSLQKLLTRLQSYIAAFRGRLCLSEIDHRGTGCVIRGQGTFLHTQKIKLGKGVQIGANAFFVAQGGIEIGDHTIISRGVTIRTQDHVYEADLIPYGDKYQYAQVTIGKAVWIGMQATIMPGISIGDGAIIGFGAIVTRDVPSGAVVVGAPAEIKKYRDMKRFAENLTAGNFKTNL